MHVVVASRQLLPAKGYGGPERVIIALVRGLVALGHRVTLLAPPGTRVGEATVVDVPPRKLDDPAALSPFLPKDAEIRPPHFPLAREPDSLPFVRPIPPTPNPGTH